MEPVLHRLDLRVRRPWRTPVILVVVLLVARPHVRCTPDPVPVPTIVDCSQRAAVAVMIEPLDRIMAGRASKEHCMWIILAVVVGITGAVVTALSILHKRTSRHLAHSESREASVRAMRPGPRIMEMTTVRPSPLRPRVPATARSRRLAVEDDVPFPHVSTDYGTYTPGDVAQLLPTSSPVEPAAGHSNAPRVEAECSSSYDAGHHASHDAGGHCSTTHDSSYGGDSYGGGGDFGGGHHH